ncbi:MAG TPA: phenylacetate-CoA oxygenase subunit PaaJ [Cryomorphaceae bacterium]|jgi:ring-1,2-phenylacetyl-CoA epoxidase subunit PaaD|nr:MAG: phenylacetate-CoA oxygenase [Cryomorphaceae bacterium BACL7 MAG-120910-bin2]KRO69195.1 MAG: phenylacetate-CoA oxygenase [Cryomorphaceae bacterium BACL7 MAG-120322-bin74]KRO83861.1 MAG: phenylacetate-CoA oxygenase [Cryomorphaceae bacterium BACL7 MAG-121220-bin83]NQW24983.1 phenylacetate-CoA oxygenase subunit PaaJ [Cryomorphaceae bacterium]HAB31242.1 phenylacetate-CoA oxygenase subunit PaaJ [Cryomorphaceae bacterium]|tara:strand:- start:2045 stop:2524 length:480 start_codon:yes stop_codon:yes gene_type:complete
MVKTQELWDALASVMDPEVPVLSVLDLGVIRAIRHESNRIEVDISPTYTGCPAMDVISSQVREALLSFGDVNIVTVLDPPWTTDWISAEGRNKLEAYGIAPPVGRAHDKRSLWAPVPSVRCPRCKSASTKLISHFGSTACKALYQCLDCQEPFDYFKCL